MSLTVSHVSFVRARPIVNLTTAGRVRVRFGEDTSATLDETSARALLLDLEGALYRLAMRRTLAGEPPLESPIA